MYAWMTLSDEEDAFDNGDDWDEDNHKDAGVNAPEVNAPPSRQLTSGGNLQI